MGRAVSDKGLQMDIGRLYAAIAVLDELVDAVGKLPADDRETAGLTTVLARARDNLDRLVQHYAQSPSFADALWVTAMEGGVPSPEASLETAMLLKWLADNTGKE
jgi:hypothetical protein